MTAMTGKWLRKADFFPDGWRIVTLGQESIARIWDAKTGALLATLSQSSGMRSEFVAPDNNTLVMAGSSGCVKIWGRRHPEWWWGVAWFPEFWLTALFAGALGWSVWRDGKSPKQLESNRV
jgi:WD40 repeat protein